MVKPKSRGLTELSKCHPLIVHGQGVFLFKTKSDNCSFTIFDNERVNGLIVEFTKTSISVKSVPYNEPLEDYSNDSGIIDASGAYYWFSLDSHNQILFAGIGEPRLENTVYRYAFPDNIWDSNKKFLESLTQISIKYNIDITPMRLIRDPLTTSVPLIVKGMDQLTMDDVAKNKYMPIANLSLTSQKLYNCIAGPNFTLNTDDFPDFYNAIEYSIATPGCWCNKVLKEKSTEFNKDRPNILETYLRITLGQNNGESPGIPYVMEIWPKGHYSPIHGHADAEAIIRVLEGDINVNLYPFLSSDILPFANKTFKKDDIMWISPTLNQTHQLKNTGSSTCVTIQCYMYDESNDLHYDYFDYLDDTGAVKQYDPDSDIDFIDFKELMRNEWNSRMYRWCCRR